MPTTGSLIRQVRLARKLTQQQLGRLVGCTTSLVSHIESDRRPVTNLDAFARALEVAVEEIQGENVPEAGRHHLHRPLAADHPLPPSIQATPSSGNLLSITQLLKFLQDELGQRTSYGKVYQWIAAHGMPAYRNPLRKSPRGTDTLLFHPEEVRTWFTRSLVKVNGGEA